MNVEFYLDTFKIKTKPAVYQTRTGNILTFICVLKSAEIKLFYYGPYTL